MKQKFFLLFLVACMATLFSGCVRTIDGRSKAGMPFVKDKIESSYERSVDQMYVAAKEVLSFNGVVYREDTINKVLESKIDTRNVWVKITGVDSKVSKVPVQVRTKSGGADIDLASEIDKQIALRLR